MDKSEDNNVGLTTTEALDRLYKDIEQVLIQHEKTQVTKRTKFCLKDALHHNSYYTPLCWTSLLAIITYSILLFVAFITKKESNISLIYESIAVALIVALNVGLVFTESRLRHEELPRRVKIILQEIQRASGNERWNVDNYPHLCSPYSPCITLQWTYRDGVLVNLPWALLVKDDVVLIRPGQVSPGYCESIDKSEEYPLLHPKEVYGPSLKNANESISIPKARRPLPNRRYRLLETPYLSNLHLALEQATLRPATRLDSRRRLVITRCVEQCAIPVCAMLALLIGVARRMYLGNVFGGGDAVDVYLLMPAATVLPLMPLVFPVAWIVLNHIGNAKLRALFDYSSISPTSSHSPFDDGDTTSLPLPSFSLRDIWNNFILVACGTGHIMTRTSNMLHVLGSVTALCCVDKKGILSWPNPTAEKVFFLHNVEEDSRASSLENVGDLTDTESVVEKKEDKGFSSANFSTVLAEIPYPDLDKRRGTGIPPNSIPNTIRYGVDQQPVCTVAEVLDLTHDHKDPFKLHFDDQEWSRHISSLKPLGLGILLNTCNLETQEHYAQFCSHVTCEAMYNENLIPVTNRRCLCELAKQIGFSDHAQKIFKLEQQLSTFRHLQPEMMRRDNKFARSLQLSTKLKFPFPHMVAVVVKESSSGAHQLLSQGTADIVLDSCVDYWDGQDLCFLTPSDRKKVLDFYQRTSLTAYCTAFAYRPLNGNVSDKLSQVFLELPSDSKQLFRTRRSPTPIHWDCKTMFEPKFKGPLAQFFSTDSLLFNDSTSTDTTNTDNCFDVQCNQIFIGMVTMQYQAQNDMVHLIEQLERACIRFVHFSKENELRSRVFSEKMGLESGWNCHISLLSERTRRDSGPSECWANNGTARVISPASLPQRKRSPAVSPGSAKPPTPNNYDSNLEQSKAISFSAPSAINLEHATVKFDPEVEHPASCGDSGEGCDLATSEDSMLMPDAPNSTSPAHEHWQSLSCLTDSTEQSAPVHFDMSNRAKLPRGIDKIRPHIEQIDNVPLLVSLFTDCTPSVIREMLHIMQDFGEVVCVMTSSANSDNMGICLQADAALAVEPLYPQVCQRVPAYTHSTTSPSPVELSRALNALSCALSARREDPLAIFPLVMHARHYTRALWSCTQFWLGCSATVTLTQLVAQVVMLPPIMRTGHVLWLVAVIVPLLSISLTFVPTDPAIMRVPLGKESCKINTSALMFILWCYGAKFIPVVLSSVLTYGAALATYCTQICAPENLNCTCSFYYLPHLEEENKWGGWTYHSYTWLAAQHAAIIIIVVHFITISISFVNRHHSIWKKGPHNNLVWICTVAIIIVLHTIFTASNLLIEQSENQLGFGDLSYLILIFACVSIFLTFAITEFVKWKEVKVNLRYQRRARLDFGTKLAHKMWPISLIVGNSCAVVLPVISTLAFCYVSFNVFKWMVGDMTVPISNSSNHHSWRSIRVTAKAWYCSMCESLLVSGFGVYCDCCGVCADQDCVKKVDRKLACKSNMSAQKNMPHHWVKGNLPLGALCHICEEDCSMEPGLVDHQCCWCQRCVHTACLEVVESQSCDFGSNRCLIVPPWCVQVARRKSSVRKKFQIRTVTDPDWPDWSPLIVMGNCKSGNGDGGLVLSEFRRLLNPAQVFDLSEHSPNTALQWCRLVSPYPTKLLVAGGDGTVAWILNTVHKMGINPNPGVAIVPLGTGNDMSRVLGWGREHGVEGSLDDLVGKLKKAETRQFDRWKVDVTPRPTLRLRMPAKHLFMYNYLSVGVDAQVALDFHRTRESRLYLFSNRIFNKLLYLCFGTHQVVAAGCRNLEQRVELYLDGVQTTIPEVEAIVVLNISSWGAGVNLWSMVTTGGDDSQSYNDGKLEVVGIYSSFHMAQLQVGLATPHRIGQAKEVCIKLLAAAPVQVDGEPWEQHPSTILVSRDESANVLVCSEQIYKAGFSMTTLLILFLTADFK